MTNRKILAKDLEDLVRHGIVVCRLAGMVTKELGMDEEYRKKMLQAGLLHDIGKLKIGSYLYGRNANDLKVEEIKYVRMHSVLGYEILKNKGYNDIILEAVLHHHENYDGTGYPDNLKGDEIPLGARILRVCDVFSALVENRPYRRAFSIEMAMKLLIDEVKNFDMACFLALQRAVHTDEFSEVKKIITDNNIFESEVDLNEVGMNLDLW